MTWRALSIGPYAPAQAVKKYAMDDVDPVRPRTSRFMGVSWNEEHGNWRAMCKRTWLGYHATEKAAVGTDGWCSPRHHPNVAPSVLQLLDIL